MKLTATPKDKLFETAKRLFYRQGYRAVGVDTIAAESGVGKMTLYRHFPSKDDLIAEFLRAGNADFWDYFEHSTQGAATAREKLAGFFTGLEAYVLSPECYGCPFNNVATEYPEADYAGHRIAREHKQAVRQRFTELAREAGARQPEALANALVLLMDGAYMAARMYGPAADSPAVGVSEAAQRLIGAYTG